MHTTTGLNAASSNSPSLELIIGGWKGFNDTAAASQVLRDFSLAIQRGARLCLLGPNGCGKSTLLHVLLGLERLDSGRLGFKASPHDRAAAVLQDYRRQLLPWASVRTNLVLPLTGRHDFGISPDHLISVAVGFLEGLGHDISLKQRVGRLSGGQQQLLVLARSVAFSPDLWILDEGMSAVDLARRNALSQLLVEHCAGRTTIFVTHDLDDTLRLGTDLIVLDGTMKIVAQVTIDRDTAADTATFLTSDRAAAIRTNVWRALANAHCNAEGSRI